jgi:hypothetical protein
MLSNTALYHSLLTIVTPNVRVCRETENRTLHTYQHIFPFISSFHLRFNSHITFTNRVHNLQKRAIDQLNLHQISFKNKKILL